MLDPANGDKTVGREADKCESDGCELMFLRLMLVALMWHLSLPADFGLGFLLLDFLVSCLGSFAGLLRHQLLCSSSCIALTLQMHTLIKPAMLA